MTEARLHTLPDGTSVQIVTVDELRVGDHLLYDHATFLPIQQIDEKPKSRWLTVLHPDSGITHQERPRRGSRQLYIHPRRHYEAQLIHDTPADIHVADSTIVLTAGEARDWLQAQLAGRPGPYSGRIVAGEMTGAPGDECFEPSDDEPSEHVQRP